MADSSTPLTYLHCLPREILDEVINKKVDITTSQIVFDGDFITVIKFGCNMLYIHNNMEIQKWSGTFWKLPMPVRDVMDTGDKFLLIDEKRHLFIEVDDKNLYISGGSCNFNENKIIKFKTFECGNYMYRALKDQIDISLANFRN